MAGITGKDATLTAYADALAGSAPKGRSLTQVNQDIQARLTSKIKFPPGYGQSLGGESEDQAEVFGQIFSSLGLAVLLMYFVLVVQFGSFLEPFAIMLSLPLSLIGVMLALLITGSTINIMSMIGVILLMGIVAKNAILLVDFAKWSEEQGMSRREAIVEACRTRLRPILMTTSAIIAGLIPTSLGLGIGGTGRAAIAVTIIGGQSLCLFLTLLLVPVAYVKFDALERLALNNRWKDWVGRLKASTRLRPERAN